MIEPVALENFFITFFSAAMVILLAACYAVLFALSRIMARPYWMVWAYGVYGLLVIAVCSLVYGANLNGHWRALAFLMLLGYLLAPRVIWHLSVTTHRAEERDQAP